MVSECPHAFRDMSRRLIWYRLASRRVRLNPSERYAGSSPSNKRRATHQVGGAAGSGKVGKAERVCVHSELCRSHKDTYGTHIPVPRLVANASRLVVQRHTQEPAPQKRKKIKIKHRPRLVASCATWRDTIVCFLGLVSGTAASSCLLKPSGRCGLAYLCGPRHMLVSTCTQAHTRHAQTSLCCRRHQQTRPTHSHKHAPRPAELGTTGPFLTAHRRPITSNMNINHAWSRPTHAVPRTVRSNCSQHKVPHLPPCFPRTPAQTAVRRANEQVFLDTRHGTPL